jgi:15-cis-phytoene synthase
MKTPETSLPPPILLAIAYTPEPVRARLSWLLMLDQRLSEVLSRASEPMIAQLRLSWWRDALKTAPDKRPKGEPLLLKLSALAPDDTIINAGIVLVDGYEILATNADAQEQEAARLQRISVFCDAYAIWSGCAEFERSQIDLIAEYWTKPAGPFPKSFPRILRPLSIIALAERPPRIVGTSASWHHGLRINWHALTGR